MTLRAIDLRRAMGKTLRSDAHARLCILLKQAREAADLTQAVVAERLGKPQSYVAKTESGERRLDVVEFVALANAIQADPAQLISSLDYQTLIEAQSRKAEL